MPNHREPLIRNMANETANEGKDRKGLILSLTPLGIIFKPEADIFAIIEGDSIFSQNCPLCIPAHIAHRCCGV